MRFMVGFVLVLIGIVFVQSTPVVRQALPDLDLLIMAFPELAPLITPIKAELDKIEGLLPPDQFQSLQQGILQLILNFAGGNSDAHQFKTSLEALLTQYLGPNGKNQINIDNLIAQIQGVDPLVLQRVVGFLGKRNVIVD